MPSPFDALLAQAFAPQTTLPVVNDNQGQKNTLTPQEQLEIIMQQILRQQQLQMPGPPIYKQPTNNNGGLRLL